MSLLDRILKKPVNYVEGRVDEVRHQLRADAADVLTILGIYLMIAVLAGVCLLLMSLALASVIAPKVGAGWAYAIVGGIYLLGALIVYLYYRKPENKKRFRDRIHKAIGGDTEVKEPYREPFREPVGNEEEDIFHED